MGIQINRGDKVMKAKPEPSFWDRLVNLIVSGSRFAEKYKEGKHVSRERKSFPESVERKIKPKRRREGRLPISHVELTG